MVCDARNSGVRGDARRREGGSAEGTAATAATATTATTAATVTTAATAAIATTAAAAATAVTVAMAATEEYEGVWVTLTDAVVRTLDYDCGVDGTDCSDEGVWEVESADGSGESILIYDHAYECDDWGSMVGDLPVTGVMMYRWGRRRLMPSTGFDFE